jgi:hypothetical protein
MMNPVPWLQMTNMISYQGLVRTFLNVPDDNKSYDKLLKSVSENGLNGVLTDRNNKIKLITGVAPFDGISSMDDDFDDSSSEENSPEDSPIENRPLV